MSCRTTPAGSAFTSLARLTLPQGLEMSDPACLSAFHSLRAHFNNRTGRGGYVTNASDHELLAEYHGIVQDQLRYLDSIPLPPRRLDSIRRRLQAALSSPPRRADGSIDGSVVYAISRIRRVVLSRAMRQETTMRELARELGEPVETVRRRFAEYERMAPNRRERAMDGFSEHVRQLAESRCAFGDAGTRYATARLTEEAVQYQIARARSLPRAVEEMVELTGEARRTTLPDVEVVSAGYNRERMRLEIVTSDGQRRAYRNVPSSGWEYALRENNLGQWWSRGIRGQSVYAYDNEYDEVLSAAALRCTECGQFATNTHTCQPRADGAPVYWPRNSRSRQQVTVEGNQHLTVELPPIRTLQQAYREGPFIVRSYQTFWQEAPTFEVARTGGGVLVTRGEDGEPHVDRDMLRCNCSMFRRTGSCVHVEGIAEAVRVRLQPRRRTRTAEEREAAAAQAQARAEEAASLDWTRTAEGLADARSTWQADAEVLYSENTAAFLEDFRAAQDSAGKEGTTVPYLTENAMDGMAQPGSGQAFGMEIEFDLPKEWSYSRKQQAVEAIAQELFDAGITSTSYQRGYHASRRDGFRDFHRDSGGIGTWSFERDVSVRGGELVTSGMYDTPETWQRLKTAVDIIKRNGGVASKKAGMHVHVGTGNYDGNVAAYTELYRTVKQHEDVLYRVAANPERGTHRRGIYATPNPPVSEGFSSIGEVRRAQSGRMRALNLAAVSGERDDHPEFRVFDASLDPGTMQAQAKVAVALVNAAQRNAANGGTSRREEPVGTHRQRVGRRRRFSDDELLDDTATTRSFVDMLFRRREDKQQFLSVFTRNKWQSSFSH